MKKKIILLTLAISSFLAGNAFADPLSFTNIEVISDNRTSGWTLSTDVMLNGATNPTVGYYIEGNGPYTMTYGTFGPYEFYDDNVTQPYGSTPSSYEVKKFTYYVDDNSDNTVDLTARGYVSGIRQVPLSTGLTVTSVGLTPTISWFNTDDCLSGYRIRVLDDSGNMLWQNSGLLDIVNYGNGQDYTISGWTFNPSEDYIIRIEARMYENFLMLGDASSGLVISRSVVDIPYTTVPIPTTILLLGSGLIGFIGIKRKLRKE